jgi:hypothetical protein
VIPEISSAVFAPAYLLFQEKQVTCAEIAFLMKNQGL